MNKHKITVLAGALLMGMGATAYAGGDKNKSADPMATETTSAVTTQADDTLVDGDVAPTHGETVSEYARSQAEARDGTPPDSPPGHSISHVARSQGDWKQLDVDADGTLSDTEIAADTDLAAQLDAYDGDGDGTLTRAEYDAYVLAGANGELEASTDIDGDVDGDLEGDLEGDADLDVDADVDGDLE